MRTLFLFVLLFSVIISKAQTNRGVLLHGVKGGLWQKNGNLGIGVNTPSWGLDIQRSLGGNKDSINFQSTTGPRQMLVIDTTTGKFGRMSLTNLTSDQIHTSGTSVTISNGVTRLFVDPPTALSSLGITFPPSPYDGQLIKILFGGTITSSALDVVTGGISTWSSGGSNFIPSLPSSATPIKAGAVYIFEYRLSNTSWYQIQ